MPALLILAVLSWLLGSGKSRPKAGDPTIFTVLEVRPRRRWGAFFLSIAAHAFSITLVLAVSDLVGPDDDFLPRQLTRHALVIRLPEHIYLAPATSASPSTARLKRAPRVAVRRRDLGKYVEAASRKSIEPPSNSLADTTRSLFSMVTPPPEPPQAPARKFILPDLPQRDTSTQTVLQAELPPNLPPQVERRLPQLVFWDAEPAKLPERPVQPGNLTPKLELPRLDAPPRLEAPNRERLTSDFKVASGLDTTHLTLPLPPATTMPLRILEAATDPKGPSSIDPFTGDPVHVLAVSPDPAPLTDALKALFIPAGNQLARLPGTPPLFGLPGFGEGVGSGGLSDSSGNPQAGGDIALDDGANGSPGPADLLHALPGDGRLFGMLSPPGLTGTPLRILHPANGAFDVVVVQSSSLDSLADGADALSGRPIYTVYLQVGAPKEWIMQYCVPNMAGSIQTGGLVKLGNPAPVGAPYPLVTVRPPEDWRHGSDYLLVHGFLDESGRFHDMKVLPSRDPAPDATSDAVLQYLAYWEFRPALQDGRPVRVEVILAVPPDRLS